MIGGIDWVMAGSLSAWPGSAVDARFMLVCCSGGVEG